MGTNAKVCIHTFQIVKVKIESIFAANDVILFFTKRNVASRLNSPKENWHPVKIQGLVPKDFQQNQWEKDLKCMTVGFNNFNEKSILTFKILKFHEFSIDNKSAL